MVGFILGTLFGVSIMCLFQVCNGDLQIEVSKNKKEEDKDKWVMK